MSRYGIPVLHGDRTGLAGFGVATRDQLAALGENAPARLAAFDHGATVPGDGSGDERMALVAFPDGEPEALVDVVRAPHEWVPISELREP